MKLEPTHKFGQEFDLCDGEVVIPETCLADRIWNWLINEPERRLSVYYILGPFWPHHSKAAIARAYRQLEEEGRIAWTPQRQYVYARWKEPPGWYSRTGRQRL